MNSSIFLGKHRKKRETARVSTVASPVKVHNEAGKPVQKGKAFASVAYTGADRKWYFAVVFILSFATTLTVIRTAPSYVKGFRLISANMGNPESKKVREVKLVGNEKFLHIDPILLKTYIDSNDRSFALIDTRSEAEYKLSHIKHAVNVPLYADFRRPYESLISRDKWLPSVRTQVKGNKEIIVYGYRTDADLLLIAVGVMRNKGIQAKILSVSYGDWVGGFPMWLPGHELYGSFNINDYIERTNQ